MLQMHHVLVNETPLISDGNHTASVPWLMHARDVAQELEACITGFALSSRKVPPQTSRTEPFRKPLQWRLHHR
jgi:hypothetical protein